MTRRRTASGLRTARRRPLGQEHRRAGDPPQPDLSSSAAATSSARPLLDYRASYSTATYDQQRNYGTDLHRADRNVAVDLQQSGEQRRLPADQRRSTGPISTMPSLYNLKKGTVSNGQEHDRDEEYAYAGNLLFPVHLINDNDRIKVGLRGAPARPRPRTSTAESRHDRRAEPRRRVQRRRSPTSTTTATATARRSTPTAVSAPGRGRSRGRTCSIRPLFQGPRGHLRRLRPVRRTVGKFGLLAGVRVESTDANYGNYVFDGDGNQTGFQQQPEGLHQRLPDGSTALRLHAEARAARHLFDRHRPAGLQPGARARSPSTPATRSSPPAIRT